MQCREHVTQLGRHYQEIQAEHTQILVIIGGSIEIAQSYARRSSLPFPVLADPDREVYHLYQLHKALILIQRTANMIVDRNGIIQYIKSATNPMTWLDEYNELFQAIQRINHLSQ